MDPDLTPASRMERARRRRAIWVALLLALSTTWALIFAWASPLATVWHFWGLTQCLPLFYLVLSVWAAWPLPGEDEM